MVSFPLKRLGLFYERFEEVLLVVLVALMVTLGFLQILFRNLISIGIVWVDPLVRHLVLWIALLGASVATRENRHIRIDALSGFLSPLAQRRLQGSLEIFSAAVCLLLVNPAVRFLENDYQAGKILALGIPMWAAQAVMPAALLVLGLRFLLRGWRNLFFAGRAEAA